MCPNLVKYVTIKPKMYTYVGIYTGFMLEETISHMKLKKINIESIDGFKLGNAENVTDGTGCTVIVCDEGAIGGVDVRGGAPATRETDLLKSENTVDKVNAVMLSGGSAFGLEAASGAMRELSERGIGFKVGETVVPIICGASLYDLEVGESKSFPDIEMGRKAIINAYDGEFSSGNHGAGTGASCGKILGMDRAMKTGLGTFACSDGIVEVGAVAAVNAVADIYNGAGNIIAGLRTEDGQSIYGSIKVLKGMVRPETPEESMFGSFARNNEQGISNSSASHASEGDENHFDIAKAMMEAYDSESKEQVNSTTDGAETDSENLILNTDENLEVTNATPDNTQNAIESEALEAVDSELISETENVASLDADAEIDSNVEPNTNTSNESESIENVEDEDDSEDNDIEEYLTLEEMNEKDKVDLGYTIPFNTTIACLITNAILTKSQANKLASILHDAYARAIKPVHSTMDGDTIFVLSSCTQAVNFDAFAALATDVMQYAIIDGANSAEGAYGLPASRDIINK